MKDLEMMHYILGMEVWTREVCSKDLEEVQDDDCKAMIKPMASNLKLLSVASSDSVDVMMPSSNDLPNKYETIYLLCYEHIEKCSPDGCKACSEVPEGYN